MPDKINLSSDQRPFVMIYYDFLESNLLDKNQKLVFIYLKKYANSEGQCFPSIKTLATLSGLGTTKVKEVLKELEELNIIKHVQRFSKDGAKSSNLYTIYDYREIWNVKDSGNVKKVVAQLDEQKMIQHLKSKGYCITKEKEPECEPTTEHIQASNILTPMDNDTRIKDKCQYVERYTMEQIKEIYDYDHLLEEKPFWKDDIDVIMQLLYDTLNTSKDTIRVCGENKPSMIVISKLMKLYYEEIIYSIEKYQKQTEKISNPSNYLLTILYRASEQMHLDIANQVNYDMTHKDIKKGDCQN